MIYFDNAATTRVDKEILDSYMKLLDNFYANSSSHHNLGLDANTLLTKARESIASILGLKASNIIFTSGATESNNLAIKGFCEANQNRGKHIITSSIEHPSVLNTFKYLETKGYEVTYLEPNEEGLININELQDYIRKDTILVSLMLVNNELGSIHDISKIYKVIKEKNNLCCFHTDATQGFGKINFDMNSFDLCSMSGHKLHGLKGSGLLIRKDNIRINPILLGGGQEDGYRSGTTNYPLDVSLAKTIKLAFSNLDSNYKYIKSMNEYVRNSIKDEEGLLINSPINGSPYILNISFENKNNNVISAFFNNNQICVSSTSACSSKSSMSEVIYKVFKDEDRANSCIRISFSKYNTINECDVLIDVIKRIRKELV